jgi:hypothetical protein
MNCALTQPDLVLVNGGSRPWVCPDRRPLGPVVYRRLGHYRRSGRLADRQKILTLWAGLAPWSAYFAKRNSHASRSPRSWMGRVLLTLLAQA